MADEKGVTKTMADEKEADKEQEAGEQPAAQGEKQPAAQGEKQPAAQGDKEPAASEAKGAEQAGGAEPRRGRTRPVRTVAAGIAHIKATFNNTTVAITDMKGGVVAWSSAGKAGFKGSRKSTAFAATLVGQDAARQAVGKGMHEVEVRVQGAGSGRESAVRALQSTGLNITVIKDVTPIPHNGCRPRKRRRV
jgi:small subunit ribosomal protein S11